MGFKFTYLSDLLSQLESARIAKATSSAKRVDPDVSVVTRWFDRHQKQIHDGRTDRLAFLSCLFPERRPDRVHGLREPSLVKVIGRCLLLGTSRKQQLDQWKERSGGDLGQCVENVMRQAENQVNGLPEVTVEEVDFALHRIASRSRFSSRSIRQERSAVAVDQILAPIFRRLSARDAKWLTRLILKDFSPVVMPSRLVLKTFHFLLPSLLMFQDSLEVVLHLLSVEPIKSFPSRPSRDFADYLIRNIVPDLTPKMGVRIGRPDFYKARSLQHCCTMAEKRTMSLERKYDGEYCQIHIDLSKGQNCIQIFSRRGRDSTIDRHLAHDAIKKCLRIGSDDCQFSNRCILTGELLGWSDEKADILPFHKLRKNIPRAGVFLGTEHDSQPNSHERLYIMFFDIFLVDDDVCLSRPYTERSRILGEVVSTINGLGGLPERRIVNFSSPSSREHLKWVFSMAVAQRWEGLVLKACDEPYFALRQRSPDGYSGHWIKLKKDYIPGLGDTADFALIGARYDARDAANLQNIKPLLWTSFFIGCLETPHVASHSSTPLFRVVDIIGRHNMHVQNIQKLNQLGQFCARGLDSENPPFAVRIDQTQLPKMDVFFGEPFVVEMSGSGFERPSNARYLTLRFPRLLKIHDDRTFQDATSFDELQHLAESAQSVPDSLSQEAEAWAAKLDPIGKRSQHVVDHSTDSSPCYLSSNHSQSSDSQSICRPGYTEGTNNDLFCRTSNCQSPQYQTTRRNSGTVCPTEPAEKRKSTARHSIIQVLQDYEDPTTFANISSTHKATGHCLTELSNLPITKSQENHTRSGSDSPSSCSSHKPIMSQSAPQHDEASTYRNGARSRTPSQQCRSQRWSTTDNSQLHRHAAQSTPHIPCSESAELKTRGPHISNTIPVFISSQVSERKRRGIQQYLRKSNVESKTSASEFLDLISKAKSAHLPLLSHHHSHAICHHGIIFVDSTTSQASSIASDMTTIGNSIVALHRRGKLFGAGKIIFLHWKSLRYGILTQLCRMDNERKSLELWKQAGERVFAGCLKWGHDVVPLSKRQKRGLFCGSHGSHGPALEQDNIEGDGSKVSFDVAVSWDWKESLSLFPGPCSESH